MSPRRWRKRWILTAVAPALIVGALAMANARVDAPTDYPASAWLKAPPPVRQAPIELSLVTYNIADGYLFTTNRPERMRAIAALLVELDADVVGLQEAFIEADREILLAALAESRLQYHVRFPGAVIGNGLLILSAWPIEEAYFHRYRNGGAWWRFWEGDWWAGKGVGLARIALPGGGLLDFYDTHAIASRDNPANETVRLDQMAELAAFLTESRVASAPAFVVGDFNTAPGRPDYQLVVERAGLERAMTMDSRIDHMFSVGSDAYRVEVLESRELSGTTRGSGPAIFLGRAPTLGELWDMWFGGPEETPLSDHPGYWTRVRVHPRAS
ncbi:MAG: endonuclease/exonuclease/phosphatase family protein [Proteobacteria bacterium]|nr:endonuclease/exonuclease/phosphatase family protein [Pseudomonadota bacterium]